MKKYQMNDLTTMEQIAVQGAGTEGLGWIYLDECCIPAHQLRGVMSSLIKKGIIRTEEGAESEFECIPCEDYEDWFEGFDSEC